MSRDEGGASAAVESDWRTHLVVVTGRSGAGRTTAMAVLEDLGFERVDRPPLNMVATMARELIAVGRAKVVIGVDARTAGFSASAFQALRRALSTLGVARFTVLYLDGSDEALRRRYTETRRRHPLSPLGAIDEGLARDREFMGPIRDLADVVIDTSALVPNELKRAVVERIAPNSALPMTIEIVSFAYKNGLPPEADLVFDCRFLKNPHYEPSLREKDGRDPDVAAYVASDPLFPAFCDQVVAHARLLLPAYEAAGKSYLTLAFGCTGGKHRSVALAERLASELRTQERSVRLRHRERASADDAAAAQADGRRP